MKISKLKMANSFKKPLKWNILLFCLLWNLILSMTFDSIMIRAKPAAFASSMKRNLRTILKHFGYNIDHLYKFVWNLWCTELRYLYIDTIWHWCISVPVDIAFLNIYENMYLTVMWSVVDNSILKLKKYVYIVHIYLVREVS